MLILLEENITTEPLSSVAKFMAIHSILVETFNYKKNVNFRVGEQKSLSGYHERQNQILVQLTDWLNSFNT